MFLLLSNNQIVLQRLDTKVGTMTVKMLDNADPGSTLNITALGPAQSTQEAGSQQSKIRVSAELLNSLLATVNTLNESIPKLETENTSLRQDLSSVKLSLYTLQENCSAASTLF
jgi:hypothetical protein